MARYEESGKMGAGAVPIAFLGLPLAVALLAYPYQWLQQKPLSYGHTFAVLAFGAAIGLLAGLSIRAGKIRAGPKRLAVLVVAVLAGDAASFYWGWRGDESTIARAASEAGFVADDPAITFGGWIDMRVESGWIETTPVSEMLERQVRDEEASRRTDTPERSVRPPMGVGLRRGIRSREGTLKGGMVYGAWLGELLLLGAAAWSVARLLRPVPFCEACGEWAVPRALRSIISVDTHALRQAARSGDVNALLEPVRGDRGGWRAQRLLYACPRCRQSGWLDVGFSSEQTAGRSVVGGTTWLVRGVVLEPEQRRYLEEAEGSVARRRQERGDAPPSDAPSRRR